MKNVRSTRRDVANLAGVSTTTVTNVINNRSNVSDDVKKKVHDVMKELHYTPNLIARSLITNKSHHMVILIEDISDMHFSLIVDSFQREATKNGYFVSICIRDDSLENLFDSFIARGVDGVFMMISPTEGKDNGYINTLQQIKRLSSSGISVIVGFNCYYDLSSFSTIECDFGNAVDNAVQYLASLGHRNIGLLNIFDFNYKFDNRLSCFINAMKQYLNVSEPAFIEGFPPYPAHVEDGMRFTQKLLEEHPETTAIIGCNDLLAIGSVSYLLENGYRVPEDVSVMCIGDNFISKYFRPPLSALSLDFVEYGKNAFDLLLRAIQTGNTYVASHKLTLTVRETTALPNPNPVTRLALQDENAF